MNEIALYPSNVHILPGGRGSFTLIEKRYLRMLKEALAKDLPFAVCMINESEVDSELKQIPAIATQCNIINFDQLESGLLSIVVEGVQKIRIHDIHLEQDGLMKGNCTLYPNWGGDTLRPKDEELVDKLKLFFQSMPEISSLYPSPHWDDISWVCQRWIEVLPLEVHYKQLLITQNNATLTARFLHKLFHLPEN
ncbi:LON peptidase substrate-binding domain-containing protein [Photobacterium sp. DNB23_23_1]|uniref:LON peptidase substrate-binding domain-containing protein n=1 Tax=Photobacterium pectinilyticum TaxID=2906793 RepID=A0ABT1N7E2_9GAMM|nr:LON peptidase substrate-binding domain-containing protein [Photobacterium sp. ZSDE20]MCQ1060646.1 LON peptidase substrate-binding domain-containing protein [Photobacterium sp. ZSDE20]MDD1828168.1 LON peptidase substrate-binding domain-containing protein [Photobacterium sp. ZSDE20]